MDRQTDRNRQKDRQMGRQKTGQTDGQTVLPMCQKILTLSRNLTKCFKCSENAQKIWTKSENAAGHSEEETNTIM